jgi:RNA polymerase sigma factor (sigma-70 family)
VTASSTVAERPHPVGFEQECEMLRPLGEAFVVRRFGGQLNHADAEDAVAEVLVRLHRHAAKGDIPENLRAAFFTSVRNAAIDQLRARGDRPTVPLEAALQTPTNGAGPTEHAERREVGAVLDEALVSMRANYRQAIVLRFGVGLTVPEIAKRQGISLTAAKKVLVRAIGQAKKTLLNVTSESHCEEMQVLAKRRLFEKYVADVASDEETARLEKHLEHCGRCKSVLVNLHDRLHEVSSGLIISTAIGDQLTDKAGIGDHLSGWIANASDVSHAGVEKARLATFKVGNALQGGEAATGGALAGTGQKIAVVCATGAAAATCVGAGVVGPGITIGEEQPPDTPAQVKTVPESPADSTDQATATLAPSDLNSATTVTEPLKPAQQTSKELGFEAVTPAKPSSSSAGNEFGTPTSGGGAGGAGGTGGGFTFEK